MRIVEEGDQRAAEGGWIFQVRQVPTARQHRHPGIRKSSRCSVGVDDRDDPVLVAQISTPAPGGHRAA